MQRLLRDDIFVAVDRLFEWKWKEKSHGKQAKSDMKLNDLFGLTASWGKGCFLVEVS